MPVDREQTGEDTFGQTGSLLMLAVVIDDAMRYNKLTRTITCGVSCERHRHAITSTHIILLIHVGLMIALMSKVGSEQSVVALRR